LCSDVIAYLHWTALGPGAAAVDAVLEAKCAAHVRRRQLPDGGWNIYEGGRAKSTRR